MAERRMFAKTITTSDAFCDMPMSSRLLYYELCMNADDDGFVNSPKKITRSIGASEDDLRVLLSKSFILSFETGVIVIKHWFIHNYIQKDRYTPTKYIEEKATLYKNNNGSYSLESKEQSEETKTLSDARQKRLDAKKESSLPYSFEYKIRNAFVGKVCPICLRRMGYSSKDETGIYITTPAPTIQHNIPISKGGKHELSNISVICKSCNHSIQDEITDELNNQEVIDTWNEISGNVSGMDTQVRLGKDSIGKDRLELGKDSMGDKPTKATASKGFIPPTLSEVEAYCKERNSNVNAKVFFDYFTEGGWCDSKGNKVRNWKQKLITWEKHQQTDKKQEPACEYDFSKYQI